MIFEEYGLLEWLDIDAYWRDGWSIFDKAVGSDGEAYDIVISLDKTELRYTTV